MTRLLFSITVSFSCILAFMAIPLDLIFNPQVDLTTIRNYYVFIGYEIFVLAVWLFSLTFGWKLINRGSKSVNS